MSGSMKVAVATRNNSTVTQHYGKAKYLLVLTVADGEIVAREARPRPQPQEPAVAGRGESDTGSGHGRKMAALVTDCAALVSGGMGQGAYDNLKQLGVEPVLTDERLADEAALRYARGDLPSLEERVHDSPEGRGMLNRGAGSRGGGH